MEDDRGDYIAYTLLNHGRWYIGVSISAGSVFPFEAFLRANKGYVSPGFPSQRLFQQKGLSVPELKQIAEMFFATGVYK